MENENKDEDNKNKSLFSNKWVKWVIITMVIYAIYFVGINLLFSNF